MTFPVFASGDVLNASDMNAVGLWLVKSQTIGTAVSSVTVTGAFSADYTNYRIVVSGGAGSTGTELKMTLGSTATGYYYGLPYGNYSSATGGYVNGDNTTSWAFAGAMLAEGLSVSLDLYQPFETKRTFIYHAYTGPAAAGFGGGHLANTTSYTAFTLTPNSGTMTGGVIYVYGYRE